MGGADWLTTMRDSTAGRDNNMFEARPLWPDGVFVLQPSSCSGRDLHEPMTAHEARACEPRCLTLGVDCASFLFISVNDSLGRCHFRRAAGFGTRISSDQLVPEGMCFGRSRGGAALVTMAMPIEPLLHVELSVLD